MKGKFWYYLFFADLLVELIAIGGGWTQVAFITKPLLMILLLVWFFNNVPKDLPLRYFIATALFFSWSGDIFLMLESNGSVWFMLGLGSFLLAHMMYILFFLRVRKKEKLTGLRLPVFACVVIYVSTLCVALYAITIGTMLVAAFYAFHPNQAAANACITGAILFVMSDSLLAINKFYQPFTGAGILIMLTYALAQFAITKGSLQYLTGIESGKAE